MSSFCELEKLIRINVLFLGDYSVCFNYVPSQSSFSSVVNSKILSLYSYDFFLNIPTSFVALLCTRSRHYIFLQIRRPDLHAVI